MMNSVMMVDYNSDKWLVINTDDRAGNGNMYFVFDYLPNEYFKKVIKEITYKTLNIKKLSISTLHRYNYSLKHFFHFLKDTNTEIQTFEALGYEMIERFMMYLLENVEAPSTRAIAVASLKYILEYGIFFELEGFPKHSVFDGTEFRLLQTEDTLTTEYFDDDELKIIDLALERNKTLKDFRGNIEPLMNPLLIILRHTGLRISEALNLKKDSLQTDILGKSLLEVHSPKNETDRYIPVNNEVKKAIAALKELSKEAVGLETDNPIANYLFIYRGRGEILRHLNAVTARERLDRWVERNKIDFKVNFHRFRHTVGTELLNSGMSIFEIQQYLGHDSMHSTRLYAKVKNSRLSDEYKKLGFIGVIKESLTDITSENGEKIDEQVKMVIQLPDGACGKPLEKKVPNCKKPNACLFCPKFITTPEYLEVHKDHLKRIQADKVKYMAEDIFGNEHVLNQTEKALKTIISRLEALLKVGETVG